MNRVKKSILMVIFIAIAVILGMSTKVSAKTTNTIELGKTINLSLADMEASNNIYCVAHSKSFNGTLTFKAIAYVDIEGKHAQGITYSGKELARNSEENEVIAAILGGAFSDRGYGSTGNYSTTQRALYAFWNKWVNSVGGQYGFQTDSANSTIEASYYINVAKQAAKNKEYKVRIYLLQSNSPTNPQELILVDVDSTTEPPPDESEPDPNMTTVTGYINISGYVWEDISNSKDNTIDSKYGEGDVRVEGIIVHWKANDGSEIASAVTGKDGSYKFSTTIDLYNHPYGIKDKEKYDKINNSHIEFEYNGLKYTTVAYNGNLLINDTSKGKEDEGSRTAIDNKFDKVENASVYDGNNKILSDLPNTQITDANYTKELAVSASTKNIIRNLLKVTESNDSWTKKKTFCADHCQVGEGPHIVYKETYGNSYIKVYCNGKVDIHDPDGHWSDEYKLSKKSIIGDAINSATGSESHYYSADEIDGPTNRDCRQSTEGIYEWNIQNVNLGLVRREQPDAAITSDIEKVRVIMKNQEYTYLYGNRGIQNNEELFDYKVKFGNKYTETYSRPINPSDIAYVNYNNSDDLKVYVTYNIILKNQSNTLKMAINNIVNYFDSNYTIYTGPGTSTSAGWQETTESKNGYKVAYNTSLNGIKIEPGSKSDIIKIEFEVNQDRIKGLLENDATLYNVSEIFSYTTYYGENTICAERENAQVKGKVGQQYAGLDIDSTPGNAIPGNVDTYEDDTDKAPSFLLLKDPNYKMMSGIVYEDMQTTESKNNNERLGNGQKEENEKGVENVRVELLDADTGETAYLYYKDKDSKTGANRKLAITYTDSNGSYSFGDGSTYGVVVDDYIIKYTYGNANKGQDGNGVTISETKINGNIINARNYKSTIITDENVKSELQGNDSDKWHLYMSKEIDKSIAVDDLKERLSIEMLKYENYGNEVNMSAYSKNLKVQIEYTQEQTAKVDNNGGDFENDWAVFDFGIVERAREDLVINKTISKVKVTLSNGQILIDGDPRKEKLNYVKAIGFKTNTDQNGREIAKFSKVDDKMLTMEIDSELLQGAKLEVWYTIAVTNNSEIDYEYEKDYTDIIRDKNNEKQLDFTTTDAQANYYYYGNKKDLDIINGSADFVVDYMSDKMVCDVEDDNKEWFKFDDDETTPIDKDYLKENGYISEKTYNEIKEQNLQIIATKTFSDVKPAGGTKTSVVYASTILANKENDAVYDNHVEIVGINGKTARTIKEVSEDSREQVVKSYKTGNYIPKLASLHVSDDPTLEEEGLHQQDDDRVRIVVTPPTGISTYITTYIAATVLGIISIAVVIVLIKRRFVE